MVRELGSDVGTFHHASQVRSDQASERDREEIGTFAFSINAEEPPSGVSQASAQSRHGDGHFEPLSFTSFISESTLAGSARDFSLGASETLRMSATLLHDRTRGAVFAHDWRDALLVIVGLVELGTKVAMVIFWDVVPVPVTLIVVAALCLLNCMNFICVAHFFLHLPFFSRPWLNHIWGVIGSLSLGQPITLYRAHHLNHHRYGMDYVDDEIGDTRDWSSIYRYGQTPTRPEALWRYALLAPLRESPFPLIADVRSRGETRQLIAETVCLALFVVLLGFIDWRGLLLIYLPVWYFGQVLARVEAYAEHLVRHREIGERMP